MVALLKQKSKIIIERKPRKTYEVKPIFKKPKLDPNAKEGENTQSIGLFNFNKTPDSKKKIKPDVIHDFDK